MQKNLRRRNALISRECLGLVLTKEELQELDELDKRITEKTILQHEDTDEMFSYLRKSLLHLKNNDKYKKYVKDVTEFLKARDQL